MNQVIKDKISQRQRCYFKVLAGNTDAIEYKKMSQDVAQLIKRSRSLNSIEGTPLVTQITGKR